MASSNEQNKGIKWDTGPNYLQEGFANAVRNLAMTPEGQAILNGGKRQTVYKFIPIGDEIKMFPEEQYVDKDGNVVSTRGPSAFEQASAYGQAHPRKDPIAEGGWLLFDALTLGQGSLWKHGINPIARRVWNSPTARKLIADMALGTAVHEAANTGYKVVSGSNNGYMTDAFNYLGGNNISNNYLRTGAEFGFNLLDPAWWFGGSITNKFAEKSLEAGETAVKNYQASQKALKDQLKEELENSVENTEFVNMPMEQVSKNGITIGSALEKGTEGFHFSPEGSPTSLTIQNSMGYPYKRIGTFTYTNNTAPIKTTDVGYFGRGWNSTFDAQVDAGNTNFWYTNGFEGNGNVSFLTTEPHFGIQLSKNIQAPLNTEHSIIIGNQNINTGKFVKPQDIDIWNGLRNIVNNFGRDQFDNPTFTLPGKGNYTILGGPNNNYVVEYRSYNPKVDVQKTTFDKIEDIESAFKNIVNNNYSDESSLWTKMYKANDGLKTFEEETKNPFGNSIAGIDLAKYLKNQIRMDIDNVYKSPEYAERFIDEGFTKKEYEQFLEELQSAFNEARLIPYSNTTNPNTFGKENIVNKHSKRQLSDYTIGKGYDVAYGINTASSATDVDKLLSTLFHEFGHAQNAFARYSMEPSGIITVTNENGNISNYALSDFNTQKYPMLQKIMEHNTSILKNAKANGNENFKALSKENQEYLSKSEENMQRAREIMREQMISRKSLDDVLDSQAGKNTQLTQFFNRPWLKQVLPHILTLGPIVVGEDALLSDNISQNNTY